MGFTNTWDNTFPPDTQLASAGAEDFRETKVDVQERFAAFGVGTLANRPTPEAGFGQADNGVLYYAKDVGVIFQWNGVAWLDVRYDGVFQDLTQAAFGVGGETPLNTVTVPAGALKSGCVLDILANFESTDVATDGNLRIYLNSLAPQFDFHVLGLSVVGVRIHAVILPNGQFYPSIVASDSSGNTQIITPGSTPIDPTVAVSFGTTIQLAAGAGLSEGLTVKVAL